MVRIKSTPKRSAHYAKKTAAQGKPERDQVTSIVVVSKTALARIKKLEAKISSQKVRIKYLEMALSRQRVDLEGMLCFLRNRMEEEFNGVIKSVEESESFKYESSEEEEEVVYIHDD